MSISIIPALLYSQEASSADRKISEIAKDGQYYRHPDSALISYPMVVKKPLGTINKSLNIAIVGGGAAGIATLYELSNLDNAKDNISVTLYESDPDSFLHAPKGQTVRVAGLKAGRVSAAISSDDTNTDHAVYEIGAMRFPEISGLMWHYANVVYGGDKFVSPFPNPGTVPTEMLHGDRVDRFANGVWLDDRSATKQVVDIIRKGLVGGLTDENTSLFPIGGKDPAKISEILKSEKTTEDELKTINADWKTFAKENDKYTLETAVRKVIEANHANLPEISGSNDVAEKINYYVELFGTVGFGTGGFKSVFNMSILETMRLLLWNYSNEYVLPVAANVDFISMIYKAAREKQLKLVVKMARVAEACHLDGSDKGKTILIYYSVNHDGTEVFEPEKQEFDYVILATTPRQTSSIISKIGFNNDESRRLPLGDYKRQLPSDKYEGSVRPALVLSKKYDVPNSKLFSAVSNVHMICCSKIFATVKKSDFDKYAPEFLDKGKVKAIVANCGLGSSYVVPTTIVNERLQRKADEHYSFLISYAWEDDSKGMQHNFGKYPLNVVDTKSLLSAIVGRTTRYVKHPLTGKYEPWWFGQALRKCDLQDLLSYDWTTFNSAGSYKLDNVGDNYNSDLLFRYHTHALESTLDNRFFLANCSYSHLGGWLEGAFMSAVNAVCGLICAANGGKIETLSPAAQKVITSLDRVVEN